MTRVPLGLAALPALALARLLPEHGAGLYLRLVAATAAVLLPGALVARALRIVSGAAVLAWSLATLFVGMTVMFAVHGSLWLALGIDAGIGAVALVLALALRVRQAPRPGIGLAVLVLGGAFGIALWHVAGPPAGDALFHLGRIRKLEGFDALSLRTVDEFKDGGPHPGYAFPLWHGFLALVARLAGVDPAVVVTYEASALAPLAFLLAYEAGVALFRTAAGGAGVLAAQVALFGLAAGGGGSYRFLALPATAARQLLAVAALALVFGYVAEPGRQLLASLAVAAGGLALVHPTYALFLCIPLAGFLVVRALLSRADVGSIGSALTAVGLPTGMVLVWLAPLVRETASHNPTRSELERALAHYPGQIDIFSLHRYRVAPEVLSRGGAVAVAALILVPLAALAPRRRWASFVLGGSLAVLALTLSTLLFPRFADAVSLSQARRAAGFLPVSFAFAGGAIVLARLLRLAVLPLALGAGIWLQVAYPGDFGYRFVHGGPEIAAWIAAVGGAAALATVILLRRQDAFESRGVLAALAAGLFVLPVAVHGFSHWDAGAGQLFDRALVAALRRDIPRGDVVFSDLETSYRISAYAPVYVAAAPPEHVADTIENRPAERRRDVLAFFRTGNLAIPRSYGAHWIVVDAETSKLEPKLPRVWRDGRYTLYRLSG